MIGEALAAEGVAREEGLPPRLSPGTLWLVSAKASLIGCLLAALVLTVWAFVSGSGDQHPIDFIGNMLMGFYLLLIVGAIVAVPLGVLCGVSLLAILQPALQRWPITASLGFGLVGLGVAALAARLLGMREVAWVAMVFGGIIAALHPYFYLAEYASRPRRWLGLLACVLGLPLVGWLGEAFVNLRSSEIAFAARCQGGYGLSRVLSAREAAVISDRFDGEWLNQRRERSLYHRTSWQDLPYGSRKMVHDYAFVPEWPFALFYGGRRIVRHCLSDSTTAEAGALRAQGLGKRPKLSDLRD